MSSSQNNEGAIRAAMVDADVVEVMVALPGQLFFNTQIPACLWFLAKRKKRKGEVLFIDARKLGTMISRVQAELDDAAIARMEFKELAGFRVASISRVVVQSATATMTGDDEVMPVMPMRIPATTPWR